MSEDMEYAERMSDEEIVEELKSQDAEVAKLRAENERLRELLKEAFE